MRKRSWISLLTVVLLLSAVSPAVVMGEEEAGTHPKYSIVHIDVVKPSMQMEYEKNNKKWVEACTEAGLGPEYSWFGSNAGFTYVWISPMENYAYLDGQDARNMVFADALGEEKMAELMEGAKAISSHETLISKYMPELSYQPAAPASTNPGVYRLGMHSVKPDKTEQFEALVKEVVAAFEKAESPVGFHGYQTQFGSGPSYVFSTLADNEEQLNGYPSTGKVLAEALGEEKAAELFEEWKSCIDDYKEEDYRIRHDLSFAGKTD